MKNKQISIGLFIAMAYAVASPMISSAQASTLSVFRIDPETTTVGSVGETFSVNVNLDLCQYLTIAGYGFSLGYDPSILEVVDIDEIVGWTWTWGSGTIYGLGLPQYPWGGGFSGSLTLATITFEVRTLFFGETTLDLYDTGLSDWYANPILHEVIDGTVIRPTPAEATQSLVTTIESWNLPAGTESSLTSKLDAAILLLNQDNPNGAIHKLGDFIKNVEALRDKKLTGEQADYLIATAQAIINAIG